MSKIKLTGSNSGYVEISSAADAGNLTLALPTSGTALLSNAGNVFTGITTFTGVNITDDITFNGASYNVVWDKSDNQLEFGTNAKLSFGSSPDLQIYHDGSASNIKDTGTGHINIWSNEVRMIDAGGSEYMFRAFENGAVQLFYDYSSHNTPKLQTSATGVTVDGIVNATSFSGSGEGLTRTTQLSHRNLIQNGNFEVFQRFLPGSQVTCNAGSNFYCMDRWYARGESSLGVFKLIQQDIQSEGQGAHAAARVQVTTNVTPGAGDVYKIAQRIEGANVRHLCWGTSGAKTITLSFLVKSSVTGTYGGSIMNSAQNRSYPFTYTISSTNWEQKSITIPGDTGGTWVVGTGIGLELNFDMGSGSGKVGSAGAWMNGRAEGASGTVKLISTGSANWYVTKVQIEEGSYSTPFENISFPENLSICKRYYEAIGRGASQYMGNGWYYNSSQFYCVIRFEVEKRATPSLDATGGTSFFIIWSNNSSDPFNSFGGLSWASTRAAAFYTTSNVSGTSGYCGGLGTNHGDAFFAVSSEL